MTVEQELLRFQSFEDDWDGQGAIAPETANVDAAIRWVQRMQHSNALLPCHVAPGVAGEVLLIWQDETTYLEAEINEPDEVAWMSNVENGGVSFQRTAKFTSCMTS